MKMFAVVATLLCAPFAWPASSGSIYELKVALTNQNNSPVHLSVYRGHPTLITMFYGSCPNVCPLLFETMQLMEHSLTTQQKSQLRVLMISIDPDRDTPTALQALATAHHVDLSRWTLARANASDVRKIAAVLNIQYRKLPSGDFNHSSVIRLLDGNGAIAATTSKLGSLDDAFAAALKAAVMDSLRRV